MAVLKVTPLLPLLFPSLLALACGSTDGESPGSAADESETTGDDGAAGSGPGSPMGAAGSGGTAGGASPDDPVNGTVNGTVPCEPFDSGFDGDELCIQPPEPGTGLHLHVGPDDYDDPDQIAEFILEEGRETTEYYRFNAPNEEIVNFYVQHYRMRPGSHHLIMNMLLGGQYEETGWVSQGGGQGLDAMPIGGTQRSVSDFPPGGVIPPEDENLGRPIPPHAGMSFEMHYVNATDGPILREAWVNLMATDSEQMETLGGLFMIGAGFNVPPGASQVLNYTSTLDEPQKRIVSIFGHRHANTDRFTVWAHKGGERVLVYEDYDWAEPAEIFYNSLTDNPDPDRATNTPGGFTGILTLEQGDALEWECEVNNRQDVNLRFGNAVYTGEMCNLFGSSASGGLIWFARPTLQIK